MTARLITIPFSHYCEKARWALEHAGVSFREEGHAPLIHWAATLRSGGGRTVPVLVTDEGVLADSTDIVGYADRCASPARKLYADPEAHALEERFDTALGPATRRLAYHYLLPDRQAAVRLASAHVPSIEATIMRVAFPLAASLMRRGMRIDDAGAARSLGRIREIFAEVDARLAEGRRWLAGDRFSAADLTFAALATPVLLPPELPTKLPPVEDTPPAFAAVVRELRATVAGAFALRIYRDERRRA